MGYGSTGLAVKHLAASGFLRGKHNQCREIEAIRTMNERFERSLIVQSTPLSVVVVESDNDVVFGLGFCKVATHAGYGK